MLDDDQRIAWLRLIRAENVGPVTFRALINQFGSAEEALDALPALSRRGGRTKPIRIPSGDEMAAEIEAARQLGARCVAWGEPGYPALLGHADGAPPLLYALGNDEPLSRPIIGIVGARNASALGRQMARKLARDLVAAGFTIVSGLARGIDAAAHEESVEAGGVAVLPGGIGNIYPEQHDELATRLAERGLLVSEMPPSYQPRGRDFPRRNRIIAGMSLGVVVVEAAARSGSLITARQALEQNREVFAVPGSPLDPRAEGCNRLIKEGAAMVLSAEDVIEAAMPLARRGSDRIDDDGDESPHLEGPPPAIDDDARGRIVDALGRTPTDLDVILRETGADPRQVAIAILELELAGRVTRSAGNKVALAG